MAMSTRLLLTALVLLASPLSSLGVDTIPCILINGKAYAPAVLLEHGDGLRHNRAMAGHVFVWIREYAQAVGGELVRDGGLKLRREGIEVAAFSTHQACQYWHCPALRTACPELWDAARYWAAPHVEPYSHEQEDRAWTQQSVTRARERAAQQSQALRGMSGEQLERTALWLSVHRETLEVQLTALPPLTPTTQRLAVIRQMQTLLNQEIAVAGERVRRAEAAFLRGNH